MTELPKPTMFTMQKIERNGYSALLIHFNPGALYQLDHKTHEELRDFMAGEAPMPLGEPSGVCPCMLVDMAEITGMSESGLTCLVRLVKRGLSWDQPNVVALINVGRSVMALLQLERMYQIFPIYENADSAMADICQHPSPKSKEEYFELLKKLTDLGSASRANRDNKPTSGATQG